jgi:hypothetical protein
MPSLIWDLDEPSPPIQINLLDPPPPNNLYAIIHNPIVGVIQFTGWRHTFVRITTYRCPVKYEISYTVILSIIASDGFMERLETSPIPIRNFQTLRVCQTFPGHRTLPPLTTIYDVGRYLQTQADLESKTDEAES